MKFLAIVIVAIQIVVAQGVSIDDALRMAAEGRLAEAEALLRNLASVYPEDADVPYRLGLILLKQKRLEDAARETERSITLDPGNVFAWLALGDIRLRLKNTAGAAECADKARPLARDSVAAWRVLAALYSRLADPLAQIDALQSVIHLAPQERDAYARLASLLVEHRQAQRAQTVAEAGLRRHSGDAELLRLKGAAQYGLGLKEEALDSFMAAMDAAPNDEVVHASVESLIAEAGKRAPQLALRLRRFRSLKPESPLGPFLLALATTSVERTKFLRDAIVLDASFWPAWFELSRSLVESGNQAEAKKALQTTLHLNPDHENAHFALAELFLQEGDRENARRHRLEHDRLRTAALVAGRARAATPAMRTQ